MPYSSMPCLAIYKRALYYVNKLEYMNVSGTTMRASVTRDCGPSWPSIAMDGLELGV